MITVKEMRDDLLKAAKALEDFDDDMECTMAWWIGEGDRITDVKKFDDPRGGSPYVEVG
jgi:hypothetical protein